MMDTHLPNSLLWRFDLAVVERVARKLVGPERPDLVDGVISDATFALLKVPPNKEITDPGAYAARATRNQAWRALKKESQRRRGEEDWGNECERVRPEARLRHWLEGLVSAFLVRFRTILSGRQARVVKLICEGKQRNEIAQILQVDRKTVYNDVHKIATLLEVFYDQYDPDDYDPEPPPGNGASRRSCRSNAGAPRAGRDTSVSTGSLPSETSRSVTLDKVRNASAAVLGILVGAAMLGIPLPGVAAVLGVAALLSFLAAGVTARRWCPRTRRRRRPAVVADMAGGSDELINGGAAHLPHSAAAPSFRARGPDGDLIDANLTRAALGFRLVTTLAPGRYYVRVTADTDGHAFLVTNPRRSGAAVRSDRLEGISDWMRELHDEHRRAGGIGGKRVSEVGSALYYEATAASALRRVSSFTVSGTPTVVEVRDGLAVPGILIPEKDRDCHSAGDCTIPATLAWVSVPETFRGNGRTWVEANDGVMWVVLDHDSDRWVACTYDAVGRTCPGAVSVPSSCGLGSDKMGKKFYDPVFTMSVDLVYEFKAADCSTNGPMPGGIWPLRSRDGTVLIPGSAAVSVTVAEPDCGLGSEKMDKTILDPFFTLSLGKVDGLDGGSRPQLRTTVGTNGFNVTVTVRPAGSERLGAADMVTNTNTNPDDAVTNCPTSSSGMQTGDRRRFIGPVLCWWVDSDRHDGDGRDTIALAAEGLDDMAGGYDELINGGGMWAVFAYDAVGQMKWWYVVMIKPLEQVLPEPYVTLTVSVAACMPYWSEAIAELGVDVYPWGIYTSARSTPRWMDAGITMTLVQALERFEVRNEPAAVFPARVGAGRRVPEDAACGNAVGRMDPDGNLAEVKGRDGVGGQWVEVRNVAFPRLCEELDQVRKRFVVSAPGILAVPEEDVDIMWAVFTYDAGGNLAEVEGRDGSYGHWVAEFFRAATVFDQVRKRFVVATPEEDHKPAPVAVSEFEVPEARDNVGGVWVIFIYDAVGRTCPGTIPLVPARVLVPEIFDGAVGQWIEVRAADFDADGNPGGPPGPGYLVRCADDLGNNIGYVAIDDPVPVIFTMPDGGTVDPGGTLPGVETATLQPPHSAPSHFYTGSITDDPRMVNKRGPVETALVSATTPSKTRRVTFPFFIPMAVPQFRTMAEASGFDVTVTISRPSFTDPVLPVFTLAVTDGTDCDGTVLVPVTFTITNTGGPGEYTNTHTVGGSVNPNQSNGEMTNFLQFNGATTPRWVRNACVDFNEDGMTDLGGYGAVLAAGEKIDVQVGAMASSAYASVLIETATSPSTPRRAVVRKLAIFDNARFCDTSNVALLGIWKTSRGRTGLRPNETDARKPADRGPETGSRQPQVPDHGPGQWFNHVWEFFYDTVGRTCPGGTIQVASDRWIDDCTFWYTQEHYGAVLAAGDNVPVPVIFTITNTAGPGESADTFTNTAGPGDFDGDGLTDLGGAVLAAGASVDVPVPVIFTITNTAALGESAYTHTAGGSANPNLSNGTNTNTNSAAAVTFNGMPGGTLAVAVKPGPVVVPTETATDPAVILVYDMGDGTFDVSIASLDDRSRPQLYFCTTHGTDGTMVVKLGKDCVEVEIDLTSLLAVADWYGTDNDKSFTDDLATERLEGIPDWVRELHDEHWHSIDQAVKAAVEFIENIARPVEASDEIAHAGTISANHDSEIDKINTDDAGSVTVTNSGSLTFTVAATR